MSTSTPTRSRPRFKELLGLVAARTAMQHGLITRAQLRALGFRDSQISSWVRCGRFRKVERGVFHFVGAPYTWHTRVLAACLASGGIASHRTAGYLHGYRDHRRGRPEISVPVNANYRNRRNHVHHLSDMDFITPLMIDGIPTVPAVRVLIDLAPAIDAKQLESLAYQFVNRGLGTWADILRAHLKHARRGKPGTVAMREMIDKNYGKATESANEDLLLQIIRDAGFPEPVLQYEIVDGDSFIMRADLAWPGCKVGVEADSKEFHLEPATNTADKIKRNNARRAGWAIREYTHEILTKHVAWMCEDLASVLRERGMVW